MEHDIKPLGIGQLDIPHFALTQLGLLDTVDHGAIGSEGIMADVTLEAHIATYQFRNGDLTGGIVDTICLISLDSGLFFAKGFQCLGVNAPHFSMAVCVTVIIGTILPLIFSRF